MLLLCGCVDRDVVVDVAVVAAVVAAVDVAVVAVVDVAIVFDVAVELTKDKFKAIHY